MMTKKRKIQVAAAGFIFLVTFIILFAVAWNNGLRDRTFPKRWGVIESGKICRSGKIHPAIVEDVLRKNGIKTIINLTGAEGLAKAEAEAAEKLGIEVFSYKFREGGLSPAADYADVISRICESRKAGRPVLVHCNAGENRTGGLTAVYRMLVEKKTPDEAYDELLRYGWKKDNMMIGHLNENLKPIAVLLVEKGIIEKVPDPTPQLPVK